MFFLLFFPLKVCSHNGPHWHQQVKEREREVPMPFFYRTLQLAVTSGKWFTCQVREDGECIKTAETYKFREGGAQTVGDRKFYIKPKFSFRLPKDHFLLQWYVNFDSFLVFENSLGKGNWNYLQLGGNDWNSVLSGRCPQLDIWWTGTRQLAVCRRCGHNCRHLWVKLWTKITRDGGRLVRIRNKQRRAGLCNLDYVPYTTWRPEELHGNPSTSLVLHSISLAN